MLKSYKYRIYPTKPQRELIRKHCGCVRFVYNLALEAKKGAYDSYKYNLTAYDIIKQLPGLKEDLPWLKECNAQSLQQSIVNMDTAYNRFFKGQGAFPKFKKKTGKGSFNIPRNVKIKDGKLNIRKFKEGIKINMHRELNGIIKQATVSHTPTNKYFVSILCNDGKDLPKKAPIDTSTAIGIDLGIKDFAVASNGKRFANPKFLRASESKLKYAQSKYSKHKGKKTKHGLAKAHEKVANQRKDYLDKVSSTLIGENQTVCIETLKIPNMQKNHCLAKSISDAGWGMFVEMLEYKANWYGKNVIKIGTFEPSSKTCSKCGHINKELTLKDREWDCKVCSATLDRDINASINIKNFALKKHVCPGRILKNQGELPALVGVMTPEAHTSLVCG